MARGTSGRIVLEVEPDFKDELYAALAVERSTLKDWFLRSAKNFCEEVNQPVLPFVEAELAPTVRGPSATEEDGGNE